MRVDRSRAWGSKGMRLPGGSMPGLLVRHQGPHHRLEIGALVYQDSLYGSVLSCGEDCDCVIHPHRHGVGHGAK